MVAARLIVSMLDDCSWANHGDYFALGGLPVSLPSARAFSAPILPISDNCCAVNRLARSLPPLLQNSFKVMPKPYQQHFPASSVLWHRYCLSAGLCYKHAVCIATRTRRNSPRSTPLNTHSQPESAGRTLECTC